MGQTNLARAFWITGPGQGEIRTESVPVASSGQAIVQALYSGVSRGTESLVFRGAVPPSEYARMRAPFQQGEFPWPVKYGYANVGRVLQGPDALVGREVFCLHPHQSLYAAPVEALHLLPADVPASRAVLAANLETALNGLWDARVLPGDRVVVIGAGVVGCLGAWLASRIPGCEVQLVDVNPARAHIARALGVDFALPAQARGEADLVLHASATSQGLAQALELAGPEATVLELSWYGAGEQCVPLGGSFHSRRLRLVSSQVGWVAPAQRRRWTHARRLGLALGLLAAPELDALVTSEGPLEDLPGTLQRLVCGGADTLMHRVRYS